MHKSKVAWFFGPPCSSWINAHVHSLISILRSKKNNFDRIRLQTVNILSDGITRPTPPQKDILVQ